MSWAWPPKHRQRSKIRAPRQGPAPINIDNYFFKFCTKRLIGIPSNKDRWNLDEAIWAYERGFYLRNDHYAGINYALLLNVRASISEGADAITDFVTAERVRSRIIDVCKARPKITEEDELGCDE